MQATLQRKRILLGVSGGIAAYKSADLIRRLRDAGADVQVVMTAAAQEFITPLTMQALSGHPVHTQLLDPEAEAGMGHIELARWADLILIAPATADSLAKLAQGLANDLLSTVCLASKAPLAVAPAMNQQMWAAASTQENIQQLRKRGVSIFGPAAGLQACGDVGEGRMLEPLALVEACAQVFPNQALTGKKVVISAGPTREAIDPVRFISNHSSGKMGFSLAQACIEAGADVVLVAGPVHLQTPDRVTRIDVESAEEMRQAVLANMTSADIFIATAAVADYRPVHVLDKKMKKSHDTLILELIKNPDIVAEVAQLQPKPFVLGFAAETHDVVHYAQDKLQRKNLDMIACNDVSRTDIGFQSDDNALVLLWKEGHQVFEKMSKAQLARSMIAVLAEHLSR